MGIGTERGKKKVQQQGAAMGRGRRRGAKGGRRRGRGRAWRKEGDEGEWGGGG